VPGRDRGQEEQRFQSHLMWNPLSILARLVSPFLYVAGQQLGRVRDPSRDAKGLGRGARTCISRA
jgi:hypothetical protein